MASSEGSTDVMIWTDHFQISGKIAHFPDMRLTDYLNESNEFLAVTEATVKSLDMKTEFTASFLNIQRSKVEVVIPADHYNTL